MIKVCGMAISGNCWKASQILRLTGHAFGWIETDTTKGDTATPAVVAGGGDFDRVPGVAAWIARVAALPGIAGLLRHT